MTLHLETAPFRVGIMRWIGCLLLAVATGLLPQTAAAEGEWETTPESELALERGLAWLARNQGPEGNWDSNDLGLVSLGALAFLADGHMPGRGKYGDNVERALDYVLRNAKPSGLLNISNGQRDMYNHGLATFVLGQAHGMTDHPLMNDTLDRALKLIASTQCADGGWDYRARRQNNGHDLSLAVMQAKALRSAVDSGLEVPRDVTDLAIRGVQARYRSRSGRNGLKDEAAARREPGQFTYNGSRGTLAMAAAGVVCLQEFGQYDDWRIPKNMEVITQQIRGLKVRPGSDRLPFDPYTMYYVGQALYQVGGTHWREHYPKLRDAVVVTQARAPDDPNRDGQWTGGRWVPGKPGDLFGTSVGCFILAMPNRYLPILQEGKIQQFVQSRD
jgi:hypothetical protein